VKLRADDVRVVVVARAVGVDSLKHSADHAGIAGGPAQPIQGSRGRFAGDSVVHRLTDDGLRCVSGEETDGNFIRRQGREELVRIFSNVETMQRSSVIAAW
jgi:hypothetical protein